MTNYDCIALKGVEYIELAEQTEQRLYPVKMQDLKICSVTGNSFVQSSNNRNAIVVNNWANETIFERIWFSPLEHNAGLITGNIIIEVSIWNAYQKDSKNLTEINVTSGAGTTIETIVLPDTYNPTMQKTHNITILEEGSPTQNTTYEYVIGGETYLLKITGARIEKFFFLPNWKNEIVFDFNVDAVSVESKNRVEQRRRINSKSLCNLSASFVLEKERAQEIINLFRRYSGKVIAVPFFPELIRISSVTIQGETTITSVDDLSKYWYYQNRAKYVSIMEIEQGNNYPSIIEVKEISLKSGNDITFTESIIGNFTTKNCYVFSAILGNYKTFTPSNETPTIVKFDIDFEELNIE